MAKPTKFGELLPATLGVLIWLGIGLKYAWLLLIALPLGPWRRGVDLTALESINWRMTGAWRSQGTIFVRDRHGGRVPIYVGRFGRTEGWGPLVLDAAERSHAPVDPRSCSLLNPGRPG